LKLGEFIFSQTHRHTHTQTHRHLSDYSSSLASAEIEILLRMGYQPRFVRSGKIGWARLTDTAPLANLERSIEIHNQIIDKILSNKSHNKCDVQILSDFNVNTGSFFNPVKSNVFLGEA
jgi:hypothetical protein